MRKLTVAMVAMVLAACGGGMVEEEFEANDDLEQGLVIPKKVDAQRVYFGATNLMTVHDAEPVRYGLFELNKGAKIRLELRGAASVGFKFYRVTAKGYLSFYRSVDGGAADVASLDFRSTSGGSYVVEVTGAPQPAELSLSLTCRSGHCTPTQQINETCGGFAALRCDEGLSCQYAAYTCRQPDAAGTCMPVVAYPIRCSPPNPNVDNRVCGCDGQTYWDACHARAANVSLAAKGPCEADSN